MRYMLRLFFWLQLQLENERLLLPLFIMDVINLHTSLMSITFTFICNQHFLLY
jgi:hypothetical protein